MFAHQFFEVHGTLEVSLEGRILIIEGEGPWNMESLSATGEKARPIIDKLVGQPWAVLAILRGDAIYVPEAARALISAVKHEVNNGRVATALLLNQSNSPEFGKRHIANIYRSAGENYEFFDDKLTAMAWLTSRLEQE